MSVHDEKFNRDSRVKDLEEERKYDRESTNNAIVEQMVKAIQKQIGNNPVLHAAANMGTKSYAKNHLPGGHITADQTEQMKHIDNINKTSNAAGAHQQMLEVTPLAKHIGELAGALGVISQIAGSKNQARQQDEHSDNLTKAVYALQNGKSFKSIAPALGVGTLRSMMGAAGTVTAGSWLYDMIQGGGNISDLTNNSLAASNPGFLLSHLAGGPGALGSMVSGGIGSGLKGIGSFFGADPTNAASMKGIAGGLFKGGSALSAIDPTTAAVLGTMTLMGTSIGVKKLMDGVVKNSPLAQKDNRKRWNLSHQFIKASDNPGAMQSFMQTNNALKQMQTMNAISPGETQIIAKLNEIAFYTATLHDIYESVGNKHITDKNSGVRALNHIDQDGPRRDMSGRELQNAFANGKLSGGMLGFLRMNEGLKSIADIFSAGTYYKALKGENTAPSQFKLREAIQGGDPDQYKKNFAMANGLTLSDVELLHADMVSKIASAGDSWEGKMLAANVYSVELLQLLAVKNVEKGTGKDLRGSLARMKAEQEASIKSDLFIDGMVKPFMEALAKTPVLSALVPIINAGAFISGGAIEGISGLSNIISNPIRSVRGAISGTKNFFGDIRNRVMDGMRPDDIKNESSIREKLGAKAMSVQDRAYHYLANDLHNDLQKIQWLLGSTEEARVQDRYTGDLMTKKDLRDKYDAMRQRLFRMADEQEPDASYLDQAGRWFKKKVFNIKDSQFRQNAFNNYEHLGNLDNELSIGGNQLQQDQNLKFKLSGNQGNTTNVNVQQGPLPGDKGTTLYSMLNFLNKNVRTMSRHTDPRQDAYYDLMDEYIPLLKEIRDCVCEECECEKGGDNLKQKLQQLQSKLNFIQKNSGPNPNHPISDSIKAVVDEDQKEKFYKVFYQNMPYLQKMFKLMSKMSGLGLGSGSISGSTPTPQNPNDDGGIFDLIGSGLAIGAGYLFGKGKPKVQGPKPPPGMVGRTMSGAWNLARTGAQFVGRSMIMPLLEGAASLLGGVTAGTVATGAAIASLVGMVVDKIFFDGKYTEELLNYLKDSWPAQKAQELYNTIANSGPMQYFRSFGNGGSFGPSTSTNFSYWTKDQINEKFSKANSNTEKLNILNSNKQYIDPTMRKQIVEGMLDDDQKTQISRYGFTLSAQNVQDHMDDFNKMDNEKKIQFYKDFQSYQSDKKNSGYNDVNEDASYSKLNKTIQDSFIKANQDIRDDKQKQEDKKAIDEQLKSIKDAMIQNTEQINSIVQQNNQTQTDLVKGFTAHVSNIVSQQNNISDVLNITAKTLQKPQVYTLDHSVTSMIPGLQ